MTIGIRHRRTRFTFVELLVIIAVLGVLALFFLMGSNRTRIHGSPILCRTNLKGIGNAIAMYTDSGTINVDALNKSNFLEMLVDEAFMGEKMMECPQSIRTGIGMGDYEFASSEAFASPGKDGKPPRTWLVRDKWANGPNDPSGNNNGHGKGKFFFVSNDMNSTGNETDYATLLKEESKNE